MFEDFGVKIRIAYKTKKVLKISIYRVNESCFGYKFKFPGDLNNQYFDEIERQLL